ncbi:MAG: hypothetical protein WA374_11780 [Acidobacteriaceae bacterium]
MNDLSDAVEQLTRGMETLERRVSALEASRRPVSAVAARPVLSAPAASAPERLSPAGGSGIFAILGKAMLGIAGAYLLRAAVQSGALPRWPVIAVSIAYALVWLIPATRVPAKAWFASAAWAGTSALILIPMLWELTLRFRFLPSGAAAGILVAFVLAASALAWKRHFTAVAGMANAAASLAALVLAVASRDLTPFLFALLAMAIVSEVAAARHRSLRVRPVVAAAADLAVFALIWIYSGPAGVHTEYPAIGAPLLLVFAPALLCIYGASAAAQTLLLRRGISFFETAQALSAALLTVWTILVFWPGHGPVVLGVLCLIASAAGYAVAFAWFGRVHAWRNYHVYATGSLALLLAGCFLSLPPGCLPLCTGLASVALVGLAERTAHDTLQFHGLALLAGAAVSSGLFVYVGHAMAGASPAAPGWIVSLVCVSAILCYAGVPRSGLDAWSRGTLHLLFAGLALGASAALLVWILVRIAALGVAPGVEHIAVSRTVVGCATALALAWCGSRWQRRELVWLAWVVLASTACKLLFEDLRHGHLGFTAVSIFLYAVTLLLIPRLLHKGSKTVNSSPG